MPSPSCTSVVRIGPMHDDASALKDALLEHFHGATTSTTEEASGDGATSIRGEEQPILITNRYFSANVALHDIVALSSPPAAAAAVGAAADAAAATDPDGETKEDGIILVFDAKKGSTNPHPGGAFGFDALEAVHASAEQAGAGDLLRLCVGVVAGGSSQQEEEEEEEDAAGEEELKEECSSAGADDKEYRKRVMWCLDRGYEYVEADLSSAGLLRGHDDRDKEGFARIVEAVRGTVWSSAVMASSKKQQLQDSYAETKARTQQTQAIPASDSDNVKEDPPTYEPPDPSLFPPMPEATVGADDQERESKAREAVLAQSGLNDEQLLEEMVGKDLDPAAPATQDDDDDDEEERRRSHREEQQQERLFNDFEGALRQARSIREMSKSGTMSDGERRKRAGDAALMLMDMMGQMGLDESDDDDEKEEEEQA